MPYPSRLVPRSSDKYIPHPDKEELLCRWVKPETELRDAEGKLAADAVDYKQIFEYSVNKIPISEIEDINIEFICADKQKFNSEWKEGEDGHTPLDEDFRYNNDRKHFLFKIKDILYSGTYPYPANAEHNYKFIVSVKHVPLISNICHFQLSVDFTNMDDSPVGQMPGVNSKKLILAEIRQQLIRVAKFAIQEFEQKK
ncbi:hypothetical protein [Chitinophaga sp. S165]|uniref:hypothetical protein n=1 Tax=Chitinophaga sp. S165 TaxID=2135462 RepID=UPI000D718A82|nr:hypothetical protein [Chitinophaga sp. S165]PWV45342.1 hypothetical protein C7475_1142 [Chitinophaga sp. S165]